MKTVSQEYKDSMKSALRNRSYVRISLHSVNTEAARGSLHSDNGHASISESWTLSNESAAQYTYATLEPNRWMLDGSCVIAPSEDFSDGWISSLMSSSDGSLGTEARLICELYGQHSFAGLTLGFDTRTNEYPKEIAIDFYRSGTAFKHIELQPASPVISVSDAIEDCDKLIISFGSMLPHRRPRLQMLLFGSDIVFNNEDILSVESSHDVDPLTRRLPQERVSFTVADYEHKYDPDNPNGVYSCLSDKFVITLQYGYELPSGTVEWVKPDRYISEGKPTAEGTSASFSGVGYLGSLTGKYYKSRLGEKNLYDMAVDVLKDAGLSYSGAGNRQPWVISDALKDMKSSGVLPIATHANCLQLIAHAGRCRLYTDDDNVIHLEPFVIDTDTITDFELDFSTIGSKAQTVTKLPVLKAVEVAQAVLQAETERQTLYETTLSGDASITDPIHIEFDRIATDIKVMVRAHGGISYPTFSQVYAKSVDIIWTMATGEKNITVTGIPVAENSIVKTYNTIYGEGEIDREENPLITDDEMSDALAAHVASYLQKRNTYEISYRGNPELETGDLISIQTPYSQSLVGLVLSDEISFNGALSGKVRVKII